MSTVGILAKESNDPENLAVKALNSMRAPGDRECKIVADGNTAVGFVGSIASTGKELVSAQLKDGSRIVLVATSQLLGESIFSTVDKVSDRVPVQMPDILNILSEPAHHQRSGWSLIGAVGDRLLGGRDIIGQRPLFWGRSGEFTILASSRKAIWSIGILSVSCVPEGDITEFEDGQHRRRRIGRLTRSRPTTLGMGQATTELLNLLHTSIKAVVQGSRVGILFSGGLDSSVVAAAARGLGLEIRLYSAAFGGSSDVASAEKVAGLLGLELDVEVVSLDEAEDILRRVVWEIESSDPIQVCVGMPIEVATRRAVERGERLLLSGCGADELFGGYSKYLASYRMGGEEGVADVIFKDILGLGRRDLLRDGAIGEANRVQLAAPFLDLELVRFGLKLPVSLKLQGAENGLRKRVLRRTAQMMGIPQEIVEMPKKAAQYSSKSLAVAKRLAKREGLNLRGYLESTFNEVFSYYSKAEGKP